MPTKYFYMRYQAVNYKYSNGIPGSIKYDTAPQRGWYIDEEDQEQEPEQQINELAS